MSHVFSVLSCENSGENVQTTKINAPRKARELYINQNFMTIFRVSFGRGEEKVFLTPWFLILRYRWPTDANIQCIARVRYDDDTVCEYKFTYDQEGNGETKISIASASCPPVNVAAYSIFGIIIATFLLGLIILMVIKVNMFLADKREFAKFEEERQQQTEYKFESPLYKSPVTTFRNPQNDRESQNVFELK